MKSLLLEDKCAIVPWLKYFLLHSVCQSLYVVEAEGLSICMWASRLYTLLICPVKCGREVHYLDQTCSESGINSHHRATGCLVFLVTLTFIILTYDRMAY